MAVSKKEMPASIHDQTPSHHIDDQNTYNFIDLPLTRLHYVEAGTGPPLVMMPATISEIRNWKTLIEFFGQKFTVYFFELPGHGKSSPFKENFNTDLVAKTVKDFIDKMGFETISLLGFSFGGILTMKTLSLLDQRVDQLILLSPCLTHQALMFSPIKKRMLRSLTGLMKSPRLCNFLIYLLRETKLRLPIISFLRKIGKLEPTITLEQRILEIKPITIQIVVYQIAELLSFSHPRRKTPYTQPCFFVMSALDPMLSFERTKQVINKLFANVQIQELSLPYHQLKETPTLDELRREYPSFFEMLDTMSVYKGKAWNNLTMT